MDNSVYIALSRQLALFRDMEVTATNVANANTTGYQAAHVLFNSYLVDDGKQKNMAFANDIATYRDISQGSFQSTGNSLDMAISGPGYFMVETPLGERYTRAGNFQIDGNGELVSTEGYPVLDSNRQRIAFTPEDGQVTVGEVGNISVNGEERATLAVVQFDNPQLLERVGDRLFTTDAEPTPSPTSRVLQGTLEGSNVQGVMELTHVIDVSRGVASTAKFIETMYDLERKHVSTWTQQA